MAIKLKQQLILFIIYSISFFSCNNIQEKSNTSITMIDSLKSDSLTKTLGFNNGHKWKVHDSMIVFIRNIELMVNSFKDTSLVAHNKLSETIAVQLDSLTSNCIMTGPAHDELHKWLLPFIELNDAYGKSKALAEADSLFQVMRKEFEVFNLYFE